MEEFENNLRLQNELNKYKKLFQATEKFYSLLDKDELLEEIFLTLKEMYPCYYYFLLLSQDDAKAGLPIMDLEYDSENISAMEAYVSGKIQLETIIEENQSILYAPLKGKQGVYGVLKTIAVNTLEFPANELEFFSQLAKSAGSALENSKLYQQSKREIIELKLINETSHQLNSNLRLAETMTYMSGQIKHSLQAEEVGFFLLTQDDSDTLVLPGSTSFCFSKQARPFIDYIKNKIHQEKNPLFIGDVNIPKISGSKFFRSIMAVPFIQSENLKGFSMVMHHAPYFFSFDTFKLLQSLIHHSSLALTNSMLREELENMIITDHLTKLHSRNYLDEKIQISMKEDEEGTFILIDIDNFKLINDTYGHQIGDEVLIQVSNLIKNNIRENDVGARWGGEELAIYLPKVNIEAGTAIANRIVERVAVSSKPHITVSCGVSYWNKENYDSYNHLFKRADEALYAAKCSGKNKAVTQGDNMRAS